MRRFTYEIICDVDMTVFNSVDKLVSELNKHMGYFGFHDKMGISSRTSLGTVSIDAEDPNAHRGLLISVIQEGLNKSDILKKFQICELRLISNVDIPVVRISSDDRKLDTEL